MKEMSKRTSTSPPRRILVDPLVVLVIVEHWPSYFVSVEHWIRFWVSLSNRHRTHARLVHSEVSKVVDDEVSKDDDEVSNDDDDEVSKDDDEVSKDVDEEVN